MLNVTSRTTMWSAKLLLTSSICTCSYYRSAARPGLLSKSDKGSSKKRVANTYLTTLTLRKLKTKKVSLLLRITAKRKSRKLWNKS